MPSIKDSVSIVTIYNHFMFEGSVKSNLSYKHACKTNVKCPFHNDDKASAHFYLDTNTLYCFSCNKHWSPVKFVQEFCKVSSEEAKKIVCEIGGIEYNPPKPLSDEDKLYYTIYDYVAGLFHFLYKDNYFQSRGFSKETIDKYRLGFCPTIFNVSFSDKPVTLKELLSYQFPDVPEIKLDNLELYDKKGISRYAERYIFPICDKYGRVVGFTGRAKEDTICKYYNTPGCLPLFNKSSLLYNYDVAKEFPHVYVVEGTCDALSLIQSGIKNVVAPLGTSFTREHLKMLIGKGITLALDNDKAGLNTMYKLILENPRIHFNVYLFNEDYKDFNDALKAGENLAEQVRLANTISGLEFILYAWKKRYDLSVLNNRVNLCRIIEGLLHSGNYHWLEKDYYTKILERMFK